GRVWTGQDAYARGLVDRMGGLREALAAARALGQLPDGAPVIEGPEEPTSLSEKALEVAGVERGASLDQAREALPPQLRRGAAGGGEGGRPRSDLRGRHPDGAARVDSDRVRVADVTESRMADVTESRMATVC